MFEHKELDGEKHRVLPAAYWWSTPLWEVEGHSPHGGIVADFNRGKGGTYRRTLVPDRNVVDYAATG